MKKYLSLYLVESICLFVILVFSLLNMYKAPLLSTEYTDYIYKQLVWICIGIFLYILIYKIKFKYIYKSRYIIFIINIILLIYVLLFSKETNGIRAWIKISSFSFQPSELIKVSFPLVTIPLIKNKKYFLSFILFLIPSILILLEPDTGNFILLLFIYLYLLLNKNNKKLFLIIFLVTLLFMISFLIIQTKYPSILINIFNGSFYYRFKRIADFKNNFQINNALIGIGSSHLLPIPLNKLLIYIPEGITDFVYSFNICNFGILLSIFVTTAYFLFTYALIKKYSKRKYYIKKKILGSFLTIFIFQSLYNILMNIGLTPIMGIPLPFFSYGGSNVITYFILYALATKRISFILDKDNNNYKSNCHKVLADNCN